MIKIGLSGFSYIKLIYLVNPLEKEKIISAGFPMYINLIEGN